MPTWAHLSGRGPGWRKCYGRPMTIWPTTPELTSPFWREGFEEASFGRMYWNCKCVFTEYRTQKSWRAHIGEGNIWREPFGEFDFLTRTVTGGQHFTRQFWRDNFNFSREATLAKHIWKSKFHEMVLARRLWEGIFGGTPGMLRWDWGRLFTGGQCAK